MKKIGAIKPDKEPVTYDNLVDAKRLERRQRDGEVTLVIPGRPRSGRTRNPEKRL